MITFILKNYKWTHFTYLLSPWKINNCQSLKVRQFEIDKFNNLINILTIFLICGSKFPFIKWDCWGDNTLGPLIE